MIEVFSIVLRWLLKRLLLDRWERCSSPAEYVGVAVRFTADTAVLFGLVGLAVGLCVPVIPAAWPFAVKCATCGACVAGALLAATLVMGAME